MIVLPLSMLSACYETDIVLGTGGMKKTFPVLGVYRALLGFFCRGRNCGGVGEKISVEKPVNRSLK